MSYILDKQQTTKSILRFYQYSDKKNWNNDMCMKYLFDIKMRDMVWLAIRQLSTRDNYSPETSYFLQQLAKPIMSKAIKYGCLY